MSQKRKRGLQRGLSEIVDKQTAPREDRTKQSASLISRFADVQSQTTEPPPPTTTYHLPSNNRETAPRRDFTRVANSIARDAMPAGLFKGTSKKLYDALYQRTRGAIQPTRVIRARQGELMEWAGVSHNTLRAHLRHLENVKLVIRKWELGDNAGATYEVFIPEETSLPPTTSYHLLPAPTTSIQKLGGASTQNLLVGGGGQPPKESDIYAETNTSINTNTDDDEFRQMIEILKDAVKVVTGSAPKGIDGEKWAELARVIVDELNNAAAKTTAVSSVPAFLTTHLKRRFAQKQASSSDEDNRKRTKPAVGMSHHPTTQPPADVRLTVEEIVEQSRIIAELLEAGYTLQQADSQFAASFHQEDWQMIKEAVSGHTKNEGKEQVTGST
ncbi:MAG: hypothetical protein M3R15_28830 [Acidobacteriota bacterium]|nr:hypothetical protein [Acidobacteriota bacterium]